jgi:hypothetical protein
VKDAELVLNHADLAELRGLMENYISTDKAIAEWFWRHELLDPKAYYHRTTKVVVDPKVERWTPYRQ